MSGDTNCAVVVSCPECGRDRDVSYRAARRIATGEASGKCRSCIAPVTVTQRHLNYWLHPACETDGRPIHPGYTLQECRELAAGLDLLLNDHSKPARGRVRREWDEAA